MCHHRRSSVRSAEGGGRHRKNVERLSVHKDIDKWLREKKAVWKAVGWWGAAEQRESGNTETRRKEGSGSGVETGVKSFKVRVSERERERETYGHVFPVPLASSCTNQQHRVPLGHLSFGRKTLWMSTTHWSFAFWWEKHTHTDVQALEQSLTY